MGRRLPLRAGGDQDEELAELQRRFHLLEDEAKPSLERAPASPRASHRAAREKEVSSRLPFENEAELARLDDLDGRLQLNSPDVWPMNPRT